jgi:branched-chain amino acid transport system ATP-binding protein
MLKIKGLRSGYGLIEVLHGIDIAVREGTIATIIGANGAGKTTLLSTICGLARASAGEIIFAGRNITAVPTPELVRHGIALVPEGRRIFAHMNVLENLQMGAYARALDLFDRDLEFVLALFPQLKERMRQYGGTLSGGEQQMLAIARALMSRPRLLLLDEPSLGLAPLVVRQVFDALQSINREQGTTILLIEQNAFQALKLADDAYVMVNGRIAREGKGTELLTDPAVHSAYLEGALAANPRAAEAPR